jgi:hypothetical protein
VITPGLNVGVSPRLAGVTRRTLYRHWPARAALLLSLILEDADGGYPSGSRSPTSSSPPWSLSGWPTRRVRSLAKTLHHAMNDRGGRHAGKGIRGMEG